jgi:hypothetical protein
VGTNPDGQTTFLNRANEKLVDFPLILCKFDKPITRANERQTVYPMTFRNPFTDRETLRAQIREFMRANNVNCFDISSEMYRQLRLHLSYRHVHNLIHQGSTSYERLNEIATCLIALGFTYKPLPSHEEIRVMIREYMTYHGLNHRDVIRQGRSLGLYHGAADNYRQFSAPNYRIYKRIVEILETMP